VAADDLAARVEQVFLPKVKALSRRKDRRVLYDKVLFPGYVFVRAHMTREGRVSVLRARGVARILGNEHGPYPCADHEIESIRILVDASADMDLVPALPRGRLVLVVEGPFKGVVGRVIEDRGRRRIVCSIDLLGRAVSVHLEREALEPLPEDPRIMPGAVTGV